LQNCIRDPRNPAPMESRMQILITLGVMAVAVLQTSSFGTALKQSQPLLVKSVVNGDTIDVATVGRVRLLGIDAPAAGRGAL
jgi:endonuclease YncB( thermonuclease family)